MGWMDEVRTKDGIEKWLELVDTLRQVTEGKVSFFVSKTCIAFDFSVDLPRNTTRSCHLTTCEISRVTGEQAHQKVSGLPKIDRNCVGAAF